MKYLHTFAIVLLSVFVLQAQNIGINATGANPDPSAALDVVSSSSGVLIPRVALTGTSDATTIVNGNVNSLLVYNTATVSDVTPGYYYWSASDNAWIRIEDQNSVSDDWRLTGNAGTNPATNFLGTTDAQDLVLRTNNTENMRIANATGFVGIGTAAPSSEIHIESSNPAIQMTDTDVPRTASLWQFNDVFTIGEALVSTILNVDLPNRMVGINTVAPSHPLTIKPTADVAQLSLEQNNSIDGYDLWCTSATGDLIFRRSNGAAGTERMRLTAAGRLGIGTVAPSHSLTIKPSANVAQLSLEQDNATDGWSFWANSGGGPLLFQRRSGMVDTEQMRLTAAGRLGIGTTNPQLGLHVVGGITVEGGGGAGQYWIGRGGALGAGGGTLAFYAPNAAGAGLEFGIANQAFLLMTTQGSLFLGTGGVNAGGNIFTVGLNGDGSSAVANAWNVFSDKRWKTNISTIDGGLDKVMALRGVTYNWKKTNRSDIGFIAQEVEEVLPTLVTTSEEGYKSVDYMRITSVLVEAVKEQQQLIEELKQQNKALDKRLKELEKR